MFLVTTEDDEDGTWLNEPRGFYTKEEARAWLSKNNAPPDHCLVLYSCRIMEIK